MRYLVLSDIHANLEALDAALEEAGPHDRALVLGDLVGYGADPNAVIERIRALPAATVIRGNHDKVGAGLDNVEGFNHLARQAIAWTASVLVPDNRAWLAALPKGPILTDEFVEICHGTPFDEDVYVFDDLDALRALRAAERPLCLFGHTHVPAVFRLGDRRHDRNKGSRHEDTLATVRLPKTWPYRVDIDSDGRYLVNCGAVGQPRDGDPRAAFGIIDTDERAITLLRVEYDVTTAQEKIIAAGLPDMLAQRLAVGR